MKKILIYTTALIILLSFISCNTSNETESKKKQETKTEQKKTVRMFTGRITAEKTVRKIGKTYAKASRIAAEDFNLPLTLLQTVLLKTVILLQLHLITESQK